MRYQFPLVLHDNSEVARLVYVSIDTGNWVHEIDCDLRKAINSEPGLDECHYPELRKKRNLIRSFQYLFFCLIIASTGFSVLAMSVTV